jgi:hypothetical protein
MIDIDWSTVKDIAEGVGAIGAIVAAIQSWRAHDKAEKATTLLTQIKTEITAKQTTNVTVINNPTQTSGAGIQVQQK